MTSDVNIGLAFLAGLVSFVSPCVLPLVPAYVGYMGGRATNEASKQSSQRFGTFLHGIFFVLGFTLFFVGFGLMTAAAADFLTKIGIDIPTVLTRIGGLAVILFGLYVMKWLDPVFRWLTGFAKSWEEDGDAITPIVFTLLVVGGLFGYFFWAFGAEMPWALAWALALLLILATVYRKSIDEATTPADFWQRAVQTTQFALATDTRQLGFQRKEGQGYFGSLGMGVVFSAGWTPCIGPVYGAVIALASDSAANGDSLVPAASMFTAYSLGLGIPFLLTALAFNQSVGLMNRVKRRMHTVELVSGLLLIIIGVAILTGGLADITNRFGNQGELGDFSIRLEACTASVADGRIGMGSYTGCVTDGIDKLEDRFIQGADRHQFETASTIRYIFPEPANLEDIPVGIEEGMRAPDFALRTLDGEEIRLSEMRGQAVLVNFWATWCGPCRAEMPNFQRIFDQQHEAGFTVVAVDDTTNADSPEKVSDFINEFGLTFDVVLDETGDVARTYQVLGLPTSYLVDGNGIVVMRHAGALTVQTLLDEMSQFETVGGDVDESVALID